MHYLAGRAYPLGSQLTEFHQQYGANFALFSQKATAVTLCLFSEQGETRLPMQKTGEVWHLFVVGITAGTEYGYRVQGDVNEARGELFNPQKLLLDPYAK